MRVVGGTARGRRLVAPAGSRTRPTTDRARESIFNALWSRGVLDGAVVVDLFAGSGALAIESLSRGAARATLVEPDAGARRAIARNLDTAGVGDRAEVVATTALRFLATGAGPFDLAFCDPPYAFADWDALLGALPAAFVVAEAAGPLEPRPGWDLVRDARYAGAWVGFLAPAAATPLTGTPPAGTPPTETAAVDADVPPAGAGADGAEDRVPGGDDGQAGQEIG